MGQDSQKISIRGKMIPLTQLVSWDLLKYDPKKADEKILVIAAVKKFGPQTSRSLTRLTGLERTNITRLLRDLEGEKILHVCKVDRCPHTKRPVQFYDVLEEKPAQQQTLF